MSISRIIKCFLLIPLIITTSGITAQQDVPALIPLPQKVKWGYGKFLFSEKTIISLKDINLRNYFISQIKTLTGLEIVSELDSKNKNIEQVTFIVDETISKSNRGAYTISVLPHLLINKNFDEFYSRVKKSYADLRSMGIKYGREAKSFTYNITIDKIKKESVVNVVKLQDNIEIRYTVDGTIPDSNSHLYLDTLKISKPLVLKIAAFNAYYITGVALTLKFVNNMASGSKITISNQYAERYNGGGKEALIDGIKGTTNFHDGLWQGYEGVDFEGTIDLGELKEIHSVAPTFLFNQDSWIFLPEKVEISLSEDNIAFNNIRTINNDIPQKSTEVLIKEFAALYNKEKARYIKVKALSIKECPDWHSGSGGKAWLFIDEILVK